MSAPSLLPDRYQTLRLLGEGAMGQVWLVSELSTGVESAMKVISQAVGGTGEALLQFKQEFRLMAQLRHPHCCHVEDFGQLPDGRPYFTMEVVEGQGLDELLPMSSERLRPILSQLLLALGYIHQLGFVHCDLKSANVRVTPEGVVKLMDYGLMDYAGRAPAAIKGTLPYLSPEMVQRAPVDQRSDLYALGCLAYELLTGRPPFVGATPMEVLRAHVQSQPEPPSRHARGIDPALERLVLRLLAKDPLARYQSAFQVLADLGVEVPAGIGGQLLSSPLIGREPGLRELAHALGRLGEGQSSAYVVHGPPGIGKTRFVEAFKYQAQLEDRRCERGAWPEHGAVPYGPLVAILRGLLGALKQQVPEALAAAAPVLVKLLPELGVVCGWPDLEAAPEMESPKNEMLRLHSAIASVLGAFARVRPLVLLLEQWQWADPLSVELVGYLLRNLGEAPLMWVITSRAEPEAGDRTLALVTPLALAPLDADGVRRMVTSMLGTLEVDPGFLARVTEFSGGTPYLVERLLEHLVRDGALRQATGAWHTADALDPASLPPNLNALLLQKLQALDADAGAVMRYAAVVGDRVGLGLLKALTGFGDDTLLGAIEQLRAAQCLVMGEDGVLDFAHAQLRSLVYEELAPGERTRLHDAVTRALEAELGPEGLAGAPVQRVMALAEHALLGSRPTATIPYALEAGLRSARLLASADAERFLSAGLALLVAEPAGRDPAEKLSYLVTLGDVKRLVGKAAEAEPLLTEAVALAETLGRDDLMGRLLPSLAKCRQMLQRHDEALELCKRGAEACEAVGDKTGAARALLTNARVLFFKARKVEALAAAERSLALAVESGDRSQIGLSHAFLGFLIVSGAGGEFSQGIDHLNASLELLTEVGDKVGLNTSNSLLGNAQNLLGDFVSAEASFKRNRALCFELGLRDEEIFAILNLALTAAERGDFQACLAYAAEARDVATRLDSKYPLGFALVLLGRARAQKGEVAEGRALADEALALARALKHRYLEGLVLQWQLELLVFLGDLPGATQAADALAALMAESGDTEASAILGALRGEVLVRQGRLDAAAAAIADALAAARASGSKGNLVRALKAEARHLLASKRYADAERVATEALDLSARIGSRHQTAELRGLLGEVSLAVGNGQAEKHFAAMANLGSELSAPWLLAEARFGLAAARPYDDGTQRVADAQQALEGFLGGMDATARATFLGYPERARVVEGNAIGFGLPQQKRTPTSELPAPAMRLGFGTGPLA